MKFADKLFLLTTVVLTLFFTVFGIWILNSNFSRLLNREIEQGNNESRMFRYLFEMGYQSIEEYGEEYAINKTLESIRDSVESNGNHIFVLHGSEAQSVEDEGFSVGEGTLSAETEALSYVCGDSYIVNTGMEKDVRQLVGALDENSNYGYSIQKKGDGYYMIMAAAVDRAGSPVYLGICKDLTAIYDDRQGMLVQYRAILVILLSIGGLTVYALSRYITRPIRKLGKIAAKIAEGDYELRSADQSEDEIGQLARNFNRMADRLMQELAVKEMEAKQKEDFTAAFAHELKTPLTSIIGYADMLNSMKLTEEENREAYFYIYSQGKRLESLSHKLLDLVSMDKSPISFKPIHTKKLEENIRTTMRPIWNGRGIKGKIALERATLYGDMELLLSLFYNLLDNASKAMDKGEISFILMKGMAVGDTYEIKVVDNGRGIPENEIGRITEAFYMVDKSRSRKEGGAGIGMALCTKIAALHGASLMIDSRLGEGTVMKVLFPLRHETGAYADSRKGKMP